MKDLLKALIDEVIGLLPPLAAKGEYGSLKEYTDLLGRIFVGFSDLLLTEREVPSAQEAILLREMLDNPLMSHLETRWRIERAL